MSIHKDRAEKRAENEDPINFTCGVCHKVHPYTGPDYKCPEKEELQEEA